LTYSKITPVIAGANGQTRRDVEEGHSIEGREKKKKVPWAISDERTIYKMPKKIQYPVGVVW
jgi:hypothetical protein